MATDISIAASGRALDAVAVALDAQATAAPAAGVDNIAARQQIRDAFITVAGGANNIGNGPYERQVDRLLFDMLPKIDFSAQGGQAYAQEISDFISNAGDRFTHAEVEHLRGVLGEAAAALPAGASQAGPAPADDPRSDLLDLLGDMVQSLRDGQVSPDERRDLLSQIGDLLRQLAGGEQAGPPSTQPVEPPTMHPQPAPVNAAEPQPAAGPIGGPRERADDPSSRIPATPDRAQALSAGQEAPAQSATPPTGQASDPGAATAQPATTEPATAEPVTAQPADTPSQASAPGTPVEATATAGTAEATNAPADAQNDKVLAGVLSLLSDVLTAQQDGQLDTTERNQLLSDLSKLVQALVGETPQAAGTGGAQSSAAAASGGSGGGGVQDVMWFFEKSGLANFLSGFFGNTSNQMTNLVMQTLRGNDPRTNG